MSREGRDARRTKRAGDGRIDQSISDSATIRITESHGVQFPGWKVLYQYVCLRDKLMEDFQSLWFLEIYRD